MPLSRTHCLSFGSYCAPLCAPNFSILTRLIGCHVSA
jgi:hypothetical protein